MSYSDDTAAYLFGGDVTAGEEVRLQPGEAVLTPSATVEIAVSDLCDQQTIADRAGVSLAAVRKWRQRYDAFPSPVVVIGGSPAFSWTAVRRWLKATGRS